MDRVSRWRVALLLSLVAIVPTPAWAQGEDLDEVVGGLVGVEVPEAAEDPRALFRAAQEQGDVSAMAAAIERMTDAPPSELALAWSETSLVALDRAAAPVDRRYARELAERAVQHDASSVDARAALVECQLATRDLRGARETVTRMRQLAPDDVRTQYFLAIVAASEGEWQEAHEALDRAKELGLPEAVYADLAGQIDDAEPMTSGWGAIAWTATKVALGWVLLLGLLFVVGALLSRIVLRASREAATAPPGASATMAGWLRKVYAAVLWASSCFYYLSLPLLLLLVVGLAVGIIGGIMAAGFISVKLFALVGIVALVTIGAVVKSLFVRVRDADPGPELDLAEHPKLRAAIDEVAAKVGTEAAHRVYLTPGADIAVFERGGVATQLRRSAERCLILGAAVLDGLDQRAFKAILAHEHGHFVNRDTAGGGFALAMQRSLLKMADGLAEGGAAVWYNPAWVFLNLFYRVFLRISHGASRLQEVLADRWATLAYGARAFERGLRHAITKSVEFQVHADATLVEVIDGKRALANFYAYVPEKPAEPEEVARVITESIERQASPYDSHPAPLERFELVHALPTGDPETEDEKLPVWDLFSDRTAIELMMTEEVRNNILVSTGILIAAQAKTSTSAE
jgi:Zn-dependent protease with chaperone function